jgi:hypothetical protein
MVWLPTALNEAEQIAIPELTVTLEHPEIVDEEASS